MTGTGQENLTLACYFNAVAKELYAAAERDLLLNNQNCKFSQAIKKCKDMTRRCVHNEDDMLFICTDDKAREHFRREIKRADPFVIGNIVAEFLKLDTKGREIMEAIVSGLRRGEEITFVEEEVANG